MPAFTRSGTIWFNGRFVRWEDATVHVLAHGLHYGTGVFEGIRAYETEEGPAVFRLDAHLERLFASARLYELEIPWSLDTLRAATLELLRQNALGDAYIRPIAFFDAHSLDVWPRGCPVSVAIAAMPRGAYLGEGLQKGVRVTISSVRRFDSAAIPTTGKSCGQYVNSVRAVQDAQRRGFDEAIFLNAAGTVAEGSGENVFVVRDEALITNDAGDGIVMGITRESILELASSLGIRSVVRPITLDDLQSADELFFTGTAVEVTPIRELDGRAVGAGAPGPITLALQRAFFDVVRARTPAFRRWLTFVSENVGRAQADTGA
jgi:branched-chain amino acid aminotransferase